MVSTFVAVVAIVTAAPLLAGLPPVLGRRIGDRLLHVLLGLAAGMMIGVAFLRILPKTYEAGGEAAFLTLGATFVLLYVFEGIAGVHGHSPHTHDHDHEPGDHFDRTIRTPRLAVAALAVHMFLDGLILAPAFAVGEALGLAAAVAVAAHKLPGGFATGTILAAAGEHGTRGGLLVAAVAGSTALGAVVGLALVGIESLVPHLLAVAGGTLLFVAVAEMLPELHHGPYKVKVGASLVFGFLAIVLLGPALSWAGLG